MATILIAWELGGGSGHVVPMAPLAAGLVARGHRVFVAVRDLARAASVFAGAEQLAGHSVRFLQAPFKLGSSPAEILPPLTFAHILNNVGYGDAVELATLTGAWRELFAHVRPGLLICDHAPTALLASRGLGFKRIVMGSGFICPPDEHPLPNLRFWIKADRERLLADELRVLQRMNGALEAHGDPPLDRVTRIYADVDATLLTTFAELDHFPWRPPARYWGAWTVARGKPPRWPDGTGRRVFAYLKDSAAAPEVLAWLARSGHPTLAYVEGLDQKKLGKANAPTIRFERERLDMAAVAAVCDLAVLNATHGTTASVLMAGKPVMLMPIFLEQGLMGHAVTRMGAGTQAPAFQADQAVAELEKVLSSDSYSQRARDFARRYADYDPLVANQRLVDEIERVLDAPP